MKVLALLLISCICAQMAYTQALQATSSTSGKANVGGSIKIGGSIGGSTKTGLGIKVGGSTSAGASTKTTKTTKTTKPTTGKVTIKVKGKTGTKTGTTTAPAAPKKTGECPQAKNFGLVPTFTSKCAKKELKMCPSLTSYCCTKDSMSNYFKNARGHAIKKMSAAFWSIANSIPAVGVILSNLDGAKVAASKRRLQRGRSRSSSSSRSRSSSRVRTSSRSRTRVRVGGSSSRSRTRIHVGGSSSGVRIRSHRTRTVRIKVKKVKVLPSAFLSGKSSRASFVSAWNAYNDLAVNRRAIGVAARECFRSLAQLKTKMACLACDPTQVNKVKSGMNLLPAALKDLVPRCANFINWIPQIKNVLKLTANFVYAVTMDANVKKYNDMVQVTKSGFDIATCFNGKSSLKSKPWTGDRKHSSPKCFALVNGGATAKVSVKVSGKSHATTGGKVKLHIGGSTSTKPKTTKKVKVHVGGSTSGSVKSGLGIKVGGSTSVAAVKPKASLKVSLGAKSRRLQAIAAPAPVPVATKATTTTVTPTVTGLPGSAQVKVSVKPTATTTTTTTVGGSVKINDWNYWRTNACGEPTKREQKYYELTGDATSCFKNSTFLKKIVDSVTKGGAGESANPMQMMIEAMNPYMMLLDALFKQAPSRMRFWERYTGKHWPFKKVSGANTTKKVKISIKGKSGVVAKPKGKVSIKVGGSTAVKPKTTTGASLKVSVPKVKVSVPKVKVSVPKVKLGVSVGAKAGRRRAQTVAAPTTTTTTTAPKAEATVSAGVAVKTDGAKLPDSGIEIPEDLAGDGQDSLAGNLLKALSAVCVILAMGLIN